MLKLRLSHTSIAKVCAHMHVLGQMKLQHHASRSVFFQIIIINILQKIMLYLPYIHELKIYFYAHLTVLLLNCLSLLIKGVAQTF